MCGTLITQQNIKQELEFFDYKLSNKTIYNNQKLSKFCNFI